MVALDPSSRRDRLNGAQLQAEYDIDEATLHQDLTNLIGGLIDAKLITVQT